MRSIYEAATAKIASMLRIASISLLISLPLVAQSIPEPAVLVRPGAPGQPTRILPANTRANLPQRSAKDVEFMQGMIHHHAQAVEMTAMIAERTENQGIRSLGARISHTQAEEIKFMRRWLEFRGEKFEMTMANSGNSDPHAHGNHAGHSQTQPMLMPGMLSAKQMEALRNSKGKDFDRLFLTGMIQHHDGALTMVKELFDTPGAGQDAELFNFATDVDTSQRAEINIMRNMLGEKGVH